MKNQILVTLNKLAKEVSADWGMYDKVVELTGSLEKKLATAIGTIDNRTIAKDCVIIVFGSYARFEVTTGSDCDWSLLIDGKVDSKHGETAVNIAKAIKDEEIEDPGSSGTFGRYIFSHDLVHLIGGLEDSNKNLTRRMLMLLESKPVSIGNFGEAIWQNVLFSIMDRYFEEEVHLNLSKNNSSSFPRFLFNDLTRFWRTMCVDYAAKYAEQNGDKWALRNAKLRFSRKLLLAAGMAFCYRCQLDDVKDEEKLFEDLDSNEPFKQKALIFAKTPPLEYLAQFIDDHLKENRKEIINNIFASYEKWLKILNCDKNRTELSSVGRSEDSEIYIEIQKLSEDFNKGVRALFFGKVKDDNPIANITINYATF